MQAKSLKARMVLKIESGYLVSKRLPYIKRGQTWIDPQPLSFRSYLTKLKAKSYFLTFYVLSREQKQLF